MTIVQLPGRIVVLPPAPQPAYRDGQRVLCIEGQHDVSTVTALSRALVHAMSWDERDLIVDLTGVEFMDTSAVAALLRTRTLLAARGRALRLQSPSPCARRILDLCDVAYEAMPAPEQGPDLRLLSQT